MSEENGGFDIDAFFGRNKTEPKKTTSKKLVKLEEPEEDNDDVIIREAIPTNYVTAPTKPRKPKVPAFDMSIIEDLRNELRLLRERIESIENDAEIGRGLENVEIPHISQTPTIDDLLMPEMVQSLRELLLRDIRRNTSAGSNGRVNETKILIRALGILIEP